MPTIKQQKAMQSLLQNNSTVKEAMLDAGYSLRSAENAQLTKSKYASEIIDQYFPSSEYIKNFNKLFTGGQVQSFKVAKDVGLEQIAELRNAIRSRGMEWLGIQKTPMGTFAFYIDNDRVSIQKGLHMVNQLKGSYAGEKIEITQPAQVVGVRFVDAEPKRISPVTQEIADSDAVNENNEGMP